MGDMTETRVFYDQGRVYVDAFGNAYQIRTYACTTEGRHIVGTVETYISLGVRLHYWKKAKRLPAQV